jgi:hypothetical protein
MKYWSLCVPIALAGVVLASVPVAAATLEYTFTVPFTIAPSVLQSSSGAGAGRAPSIAISCAIGPASLSYSTATGSAQGATGSGTTQGVTRSPAVVVVTVDAESRGDLKGAGISKAGAGGALQPLQANGYYTCWATFATGQTPVNFLPTTALPKVAPKG